MDYLEFIARVTSHIPDKGQVTVRYYGLCANAHRGKVKKASRGPLALRIAEEELQLISLSIAFYDFPRREELQLAVERSFDQHSRKRNTYMVESERPVEIELIPAE